MNFLRNLKSEEFETCYDVQCYVDLCTWTEGSLNLEWFLQHEKLGKAVFHNQTTRMQAVSYKDLESDSNVDLLIELSVRCSLTS